MKSTVVWILIVLNALLFAALLSRVATPNAAFAQPRQGDNRPGDNRPDNTRPSRPGDYLMIPGEVTGGSTSVVYVLDTTNGLLGALAYDDSIKQLQSMPGRIDLQQVFSQAAPRVVDDNDKKEKKRY